MTYTKLDTGSIACASMMSTAADARLYSRNSCKYHTLVQESQLPTPSAHMQRRLYPADFVRLDFL